MSPVYLRAVVFRQAILPPIGPGPNHRRWGVQTGAPAWVYAVIQACCGGRYHSTVLRLLYETAEALVKQDGAPDYLFLDPDAHLADLLEWLVTDPGAVAVVNRTLRMLIPTTLGELLQAAQQQRRVELFGRLWDALDRIAT